MIIMITCFTWNNKSDNWNISCILIELLQGELYYQTHDTYEHLAMIEKSQGLFPYHMVETAEREV